MTFCSPDTFEERRAEAEEKFKDIAEAVIGEEGADLVSPVSMHLAFSDEAYDVLSDAEKKIAPQFLHSHSSRQCAKVH